MILELIENKESKWQDTLHYILPRATHVEFNVLYSDKQLYEFLEEYKKSIIQVTDRKDKIYSSGKVIRMKLTNKVKEFMKTKSFYDYQNWFLEDPSFYIENKEVITTITHEGYLFIDPKQVDITYFSTLAIKYKSPSNTKCSLCAAIRRLFCRNIFKKSK